MGAALYGHTNAFVYLQTAVELAREFYDVPCIDTLHGLLSISEAAMCVSDTKTALRFANLLEVVREEVPDTDVTPDADLAMRVFGGQVLALTQGRSTVIIRGQDNSAFSKSVNAQLLFTAGVTGHEVLLDVLQNSCTEDVQLWGVSCMISEIEELMETREELGVLTQSTFVTLHTLMYSVA
jgi:hypothetical protein